MFYHPKKFRLKLSTRKYPSAGFTLIELLMAIVVMGVVSSFISYALSSMINSNQNLAKEQNRRVEVSRALDLIANDLEISQIVPATLPTGVTGATPVLSMDIIKGACTTPNTAKNRISYYIKTVPTTSTSQLGPNVIYRHGLISRSDPRDPANTPPYLTTNGKIDCSDSLPTGDGDAIADAIDIGTTISQPTCISPAVSNGTTGFYSCGVNINVNASNIPTEPTIPQQVSIALYTKLSNTKTYGLNRTFTSGYVPDTTTTTNDCTVPDLTSSTSTANTLTLANDAIRDAARVTASTANDALANKLLGNGINIEGGGTVITQNPLPGAKIPCGKGLVTYTY
jgi:prepilin-type N-terminal cleavage/methylation domain-containing protein